MILLPRDKIIAAREARGSWEVLPPPALLQEHLGRDPWKIAVASMLLCRTHRRQAEPCFLKVLERWGAPELLARAELAEVETVCQPCGLRTESTRNRARAMTRMSTKWFSSSWEDMRELPGVGLYVADAVGMFVFDCYELDSNDGVLHGYAARATRKVA